MMAPFFKDKEGLEIGGPTRMFSNNRLIPLYGLCRRIDNCNFANQTIWTTGADNVLPGLTVGRQFVAEASDLSCIPGSSYDFLLACHILEHVANPLRALQEWARVLKDGGTMLVIVPDKRTTFDHNRPFTTFEHIEADFRANTSEADLTHLEEIVALHDLALDPGVRSRAELRERSLRNYSVRAMHHHVFSPPVLETMFRFCDLEVLNISHERPEHILIFGRKRSAPST